MRPGVASRVAAAELLDRILLEGAYTNVVVPNRVSALEDRSRRQIQRLVLTAVRMLRRIDRTIAAYARRPPARIDAVALAGLRIGVTEILFLTTPPHAAVDGAVAAVRERGGGRAAGFVNATLRAVAAGGEPDLPAGIAGDALRLGVPEWILRRLSAAWGIEEARAFLEASNHGAPIGVRARPGAPAAGAPVPGIPGAFTGGAPAEVRRARERGEVVIADPASVAVGLAAGPRPGDVVADVAAAPGGKTLHLWDLMEGRGVLLAMDRHARRARSGRTRLARLGVRVPWVVGDARRPPLAENTFDLVLLDAPCTGLGTLRRRPEIRHRLRPGAPAALGERQRAMVEAARRLVRPGGRLVYSVCTVFPEETVAVVAGMGAHPPEGLPGRRWGDGLLLAPHLTATDGMFLAVVER